MTKQTSSHPNFGMFTQAGNYRVLGIVIAAQQKRQTWAEVYQELVKLQLSDYKMFGECLDTEVRAQVYHKLGFQNTNQSFYI